MHAKRPIDLLRTVTLLLLLALLPHPVAAQFTGKSHVHIGIILPLKEKSARGNKMVEFYQGMLLAVDSLRHEGLNVDVTALHSGTSAAEMDELLMNHSLRDCDVIFGPLDGVQLPALADYCDLNGLRLVVPFSTLTTQLSGHPLYYMVSAPRNVVQHEAAWFVKNHFADTNIIVLGTSTPDEESRQFIQAVREAVGSDHIRQVPANADEAALEVATNPLSHNLILLDGASLKTLNITLPLLREYRRKHPDVQFSLMGGPVWQTYTQQLLQDFYTLDTYVYTPFYRNPLSLMTREFDSRFVRWFHRPPQPTFPRYAQLGFDLGYYFLRGLSLYGDRLEDSHSRVPTHPYQSNFCFLRQDEDGGFINNYVQLVHYSTNQTIEIITRNR